MDSSIKGSRRCAECGIEMKGSIHGRKHTHIRMHAGTHTHMHTQRHSHTHTCTLTHMHVHVRAHIHTHTYTHTMVMRRAGFQGSMQQCRMQSTTKMLEI